MKRALLALIILALIVVATTGVAVAYLTTEISCTYTHRLGLFTYSDSGQQTNWEKLTGGVCHSNPTKAE